MFQPTCVHYAGKAFGHVIHVFGDAGNGLLTW